MIDQSYQYHPESEKEIATGYSNVSKATTMFLQ